MTFLRPVSMIGVELEGAWTRRPPAWKHDGSVQVPKGIAGEVASPPFRSWHVAAEWIRQTYPQHVDKSCGLHVHVSFLGGLRDAARLVDSPAFGVYLADKLRAWPQKSRYRGRWLRERLDGDNSYCRDEWTPEAMLPNVSRYRAVNAGPAFDKHRTVEIRVLPMFRNAEYACSAVQRVVACVAVWLRKHPDGPLPIIDSTIPVAPPDPAAPAGFELPIIVPTITTEGS